MHNLQVFYNSIEFKEIPKYEGYFISRSGMILSFLDRRPKILTPHLNKYGYLQIHLQFYSEKSRNKKIELVHRLVAKTYISNPNCLDTVNHKDFNKLNNDVNNLEWMSFVDNSKHYHVNKKRIYKKGEENFNSKLTNKDVLKIRELRKSGYKLKYIGDLFNITTSNVSCICLNKSWN